MGVSRVLHPVHVSRYCCESGCDRCRCSIAKKYGGRLRIYWNNLIFLSVQFESDSTTIVVFLSNWFPLDDCGTLARETFRTSRRSIVNYSFLFNLVYFVTVCGIAAFPGINFLPTAQQLPVWRGSWLESGILA